jgi:hypothetical protein
MTDRELLEWAAKAAGVFLTPTTMVEVFPGFEWSEADDPIFSDFGAVGTVAWHGDDGEPAGTEKKHWNPLTDDGDALRLAVRMGIAIRCDDPKAASAGWSANQRGAPTTDGKGPWYWKEWHWNPEKQAADPYAATRRAIVRAAAAIGQSLAATSSGDSR